MRAAVFTDFGEPLDVRDVDAPDADEDGVVVELEACGICRSDWHGWIGDWKWRGVDFDEGHIFGHEPAGTVIEVGDDVENVREGDHVAVPFNLGDGTCQLCKNGHSNVCENRMGLGFAEEAQGAWAEEVHVPWADHNVVGLRLVRSPGGLNHGPFADPKDVHMGLPGLRPILLLNLVERGRRNTWIDLLQMPECFLQRPFCRPEAFVLGDIASHDNAVVPFILRSGLDRYALMDVAGEDL